MKFFSRAIHRPITTIMFFSALVLLGMVAWQKIPLQMLPNLTAPGGGVDFWAVQMMSPDELERDLIRPIEGAIFQLPNVKNVRVYSWGGRGGFFFIEFEYGTNVKYRIVELQEKLDAIRRSFPPRSLYMEAFPFDTSFFNKEMMDLALKGPDSDPGIEAVDVERLRQQLQDIDGIAKANIWGGREHSVDISIMQDRLREFGLPMWQVINTVQTYANEPVFLGNIQERGTRHFVRLDGQFQTSSQIEDVVVKDDGNIAVRHLGQVDDAQRDRRFLRRLDGQPVLSMNLEREAETNPIQLSSRVRGQIEEINQTLPEGYELAIMWDLADEIRGMLTDVSQLALVGIILSMVVLYLFIRNIRMSLIVCIVIPICVITTFNAMYFSSMSINIVSLLGLAVGIGTLIDTSIVVLENIFRNHERIHDPYRSAERGTNEVGRAVFAFTLTNVVVFLPIVFIDGQIRLMFTEGALAIIYPMVVSMFLALTLVPMATSRLLALMDRTRSMAGLPAAPKHPPRPAEGLSFAAPSPWLAPVVRWVPTMHHARQLYLKALKACLRHRVRFVIAIILVITYTCYYTMWAVNRDVMDEPGGDSYFHVNVYLPIGTRQEFTVQAVNQVEDILEREVPEREALHSFIEDDNAHIRVHLADNAERESETIKEELRPWFEAIGNAEVTFERSRNRGENQTPNIDSGRGGLIEIRGPEYQQINKIADNLAIILEQVDGIRELTNENEQGRMEVRFILDRESASLLQITPQLISQSIQTSQRRGEFATIQMKRGDREIDIIFNMIPNPDELDPNSSEADMEGLTIEELKEVQVFAPSLGTTVALQDLGRFDYQRGLGNMQRENRERIGRVYFSTAPNSNFEEIEEGIETVLSTAQIPAGYRVTLGGKSERIDEDLEQVYTMAILALILVYMCIASLFESFVQPFVVLFSVPLAIIGIVWALIWTNTSFTEMAGLGVLFLIGILPNSSILFVHFATYLRRERNFNRTRAIMMSGSTRLRPIFMTVLTTILGILPMALGDEEWTPFAVTVIGGLASSTVLALIVVPGFYVILEDIANVCSSGIRYLTSWRWLFVFWNRNKRLQYKEELTAYRVTEPREFPTTVEVHHLTRIYERSHMEQWTEKLQTLFKSMHPSPTMGFVPQPAALAPGGNTRNKALDSVSFTLKPGLTGLLGPNGAGKTTLLRLIAGIDQPTRGSVSVCDLEMKTERGKAQKRIGYLPQHFGLYGSMTATQYLDFHAHMKGIRDTKARNRLIQDVLETVTLSDQTRIPVGQFSGGMKRRMGLAQILLQPPQILIVDEPTAGLDPMERVRFRNLLGVLAKDRVVILSTHIVEDIAFSCNRVLLLDQGTIRFDGTPAEMIEQTRGAVWQTTMPDETTWHTFRHQHIIAAQSQTSDGVQLRVISPHEPLAESRPCEPTLEDAYLHFTTKPVEMGTNELGRTTT